MALSVETLKQIRDKIIRETCGPDVTVNGAVPLSVYIVNAFDELIAIKEQKPVMYAPDFGDGRGPDYFFSFITAEEVEAECDGYVEIVPLIRKPE